jgi:hypothetical protein
MKLNTGSKLTETQIEENYNYFIDFVKTTFVGERLDKLLFMYSEDELGLRMATNPASPFLHFHNAHNGGYCQHVMNVCKASVGMKKMYGFMGGTIDFNDEQMLFSALHHDLGKLGGFPSDPENNGNYYVSQDSDWHRKNNGEMYKMNDENQYMPVSDRTVYLLQKYDIKFDWKEQIGIKCTDGIYDSSNEKYLKVFRQGQVLKTSLPYILHAADYFSTKCEFDQWKSETN